MTDWITIDGSQGEGGGQILRTALALSLVSGRPFRIEHIRAGRPKPGLLRQHLTAVQAALNVSGGRAKGAELGATTLAFEPAPVRGGEYCLAVGTAGSTTLVLQSILPALLLAREPSTLTIEGGTHNPGAPPYDFLANTFAPVIRRMGVSVALDLETFGFYPAGGGRFTVKIDPAARLNPVSLLDRGEPRVRAKALVATLPEHIGKRELAVVRERLGLPREACRVESIDGAVGPGNVVMIMIEGDSVVEVVTGFGKKGVTAETVAGNACDEALAFLQACVPVGIHLADQLLIPMALAGAGTFRTLAPTNHTLTNAAVIQRFLDVSIKFDHERGAVHRVTVDSSTTGARS